MEIALKKEKDEKIKLEIKLKNTNLKILRFRVSELEHNGQDSSINRHEMQEILKTEIQKFLREQMNLDNVDIDTCYRMGASNRLKDKETMRLTIY